MAALKYLGAGFSAGGQWFAGDAAADIGKSTNAQFQARAATRRAVAQREAEEERKNGALIAGRAVAVMAANGGTTDDVGALAQLGMIQSEQEYRAAIRLWTGEDEAAGMEEAGAIAEAEGKAKRTAYRFGAASTLLSSAADWYEPAAKATGWKADPKAKKGTINNPKYWHTSKGTTSNPKYGWAADPKYKGAT